MNDVSVTNNLAIRTPAKIGYILNQEYGSDFLASRKIHRRDIDIRTGRE